MRSTMGMGIMRAMKNPGLVSNQVSSIKNVVVLDVFGKT